MCSKSLLVFFCYLTNYHKFIRSQHIFFNFTSFLWQKSGYSWARLLFSVSKCCNQGISQAALLPRVLIWAHLVVGRIQFLAIVGLISPIFPDYYQWGALSASKSHLHSLSCGCLHLQCQQWRISFISHLAHCWLIPIVGRIWFHTLVGLRSLFPCWLLA